MLAEVLLFATLSGTIVQDQDHDGQLSPGEPGLAGVVVAVDARRFTRTDAVGHYVLDAEGPGTVWVRIPDGFAPTATWRAVNGGAHAGPTSRSRWRGPYWQRRNETGFDQTWEILSSI